MPDPITSAQGTGYPQILVRQSLEQGKPVKSTEDSRFEKMLKEEEKKVQPAARAVHPIARLYASMDYNKTKSRKKTYPQQQIIREEGNKTDILA